MTLNLQQHGRALEFWRNEGNKIRKSQFNIIVITDGEAVNVQSIQQSMKYQYASLVPWKVVHIDQATRVLVSSSCYFPMP